jgi:Zn finger protein HypA/HybF involved in hydrogenase expression
MTNNSWFKNRTAILATMHQKEKAIAPLLETKVGIKVIVPSNFNTDRFGTFTREIKRLGTQIEAAKLKAQAALDISGETLAIASEGSFYPHPAFPFISCDREIVLLCDRQNNLEIIGQEIATETNHQHQQIKTIEEALEFASKVGFPEHALVVMTDSNPLEKTEIIKGIVTEKELIESVELAFKKGDRGTVHIETDMRAMYNPTRMKVITKATRNLIEKLNRFCPQCSYPGFEIKEHLPGLACSWCDSPTSAIKAIVYQCQKCNYHQEILFPNDVETADPSLCSYCNP